MRACRLQAAFAGKANGRSTGSPKIGVHDFAAQKWVALPLPVLQASQRNREAQRNRLERNATAALQIKPAAKPFKKALRHTTHGETFPGGNLAVPVEIDANHHHV